MREYCVMEFESPFRRRPGDAPRILPYHVEDLDDLDSRGLLNFIIRNQVEQERATLRLQASLKEADVKIDEIVRQQALLQNCSEYARWQAKNLRYQVQDIRKTMECAPRFPSFNGLPREIRVMIWEAALPGRTVIMADQKAPGGLSSFFGFDKHSRYGPPAVAHACKESRAVALRTGDFRGLLYSYKDSSHGWRRKTQWGWFDGCRDTLALATTTYSLLKNGCDMGSLTRIAQHVVAMPSKNLGTLLEILFDPNIFPVLRSLGFQTSSLHAQFLTDVMEDINMFGFEGGLEAFRDVDDVCRIDHLREDTAELSGKNFRWNLDNLDEAKNLHRGSLWTWAQYQDVLAIEWCKRRPTTTQKVPSFKRVVKLFKWPEKHVKRFLGELLRSRLEQTCTPVLPPPSAAAQLLELSLDEKEK